MDKQKTISGAARTQANELAIAIRVAKLHKNFTQDAILSGRAPQVLAIVDDMRTHPRHAVEVLEALKKHEVLVNGEIGVVTELVNRKRRFQNLLRFHG